MPHTRFLPRRKYFDTFDTKESISFQFVLFPPRYGLVTELESSRRNMSSEFEVHSKVGDSVGNIDGLSVGVANVGCGDGGRVIGDSVGISVGAGDGLGVGCFVGDLVGLRSGELVGKEVGVPVGLVDVGDSVEQHVLLHITAISVSLHGFLPWDVAYWYTSSQSELLHRLTGLYWHGVANESSGSCAEFDDPSPRSIKALKIRRYQRPCPAEPKAMPFPTA